LVANGLAQKLGLRKFDRIIISLTNRLELAVFTLAVFKAGGIVVPVNYGLKAGGIRYIASNCGAKIIVSEPDVFKWNIGDKEKIPSINHWIFCGEKSRGLDWGIDYASLQNGMNPEQFDTMVNIIPDDVVMIAYTPGTTGKPKGAMITGRNLTALKRIRFMLSAIRREHLSLLTIPLCHIFGLVSVLGSIRSGQTVIILRFFEPKKVLNIIQERKVTGFVGVPAMYAMMMKSGAENYDLTYVRFWMSGADAMPVNLINQFKRMSGGKFIEGYGLAETAPVVTVNAWFMHKTGTIGIPIPGIKVRIMDENGRMLRRREVGELVVKGPNVMKGYWNDSERTLDAFRFGWFHTGDLARKSRLGYITFVDRKKDVIKSGGYSIFTCEVEEEIRAHPAVAEAALIGIPDEIMGELPLAVVSLKPGETASEEEIIQWCRTNIAPYKAPRKVKILRPEEIPRTLTMKILKRELRQMYADVFRQEGDSKNIGG